MAKHQRCDGVGSELRNVTRSWVGSRLPVVGECQSCGQQAEATRNWTAKFHRAPTAPSGKPNG